LNLRRDQDGKWNLAGLLRARRAKPPPPNLLEDGLSVRNGRISIAVRRNQQQNDWKLSGINAFVQPVGGCPDVLVFDGAVSDDDWGHFDFRGGVDGPEKRGNVRVEAFGLELSEERVLNLPVVGAKLWGVARPEGMISVTAQIASQFGAAPKVAYDVRVQCLNASARYAVFPLPVSHLTGNVVITDGCVHLQGLRCVIPCEGSRSAYPEVDGTIDLKRRSVTVDVSARDVRISKQIVDAIPRVGPQLWQRLRPSGRADVAVTVKYTARPSKKVSYAVLVNCHGCQVRPTMVKAPLSDLRGPIEIADATVTAERFHGEFCRGEFVSDFHLDFRGGAKRYEGEVSFSELDLADLLSQWGTGKASASGKLSGELAFRAQGSSLADLAVDNGKVRLTSGEVGELPVLLGLFDVLRLAKPTRESFREGEAQFRVDQGTIHIEKLRLLSSTIEIAGKGRAYFDGRIDMHIVVGVDRETVGRFLPIPFVREFVEFTVGNITKVFRRVHVGGTVWKPKATALPKAAMKRSLKSIRSVFDLLTGTQAQKEPDD